MSRKLFFALLMLLVPALLYAQSGKLRGTIVDKATGESLIGANVIIEGTNLGASTDLNGEYIILNVPPGVYTMKTSYIGFAPVTVSNVRVSSNLTTTQDVELSSMAIQVGEVVVIADRPLIQRNTTNTVRMTTQETIRNIPVRGLQNILALEAGVVQQGGNLYVRGGRSGEVAYFVDGATATNPLFNTQSVGIIQEALEEIQLQSGGYTAEFGGANSGIARATVRTGGSEFKATIDYQTDDFATPGNQFLGTSSFGYRNAVITASGPLPAGVKFFLAGQHNFLRNRQAMWLEPFTFENLTTDELGARPVGTPLPGPVEIKRNHLYNNWQEDNSLQGTILVPLDQIKLRFTGNYSSVELPLSNDWPTTLANYFRQDRTLRQTTDSYFAGLRATHVLGSRTFYEVGISYQNRSLVQKDPIFGENWESFSDSIANAEQGFTEFRRRFAGPLAYSVINGFTFNHEQAPNNTFQRNSQEGLGFSLDVTSQLDPQWEFKAGGRLDAWTMRAFIIGSISGYREFRDGPLGTTPATFADEQERRVRLSKAGTVNHYGYDIDGNVTDDGFDAPRQPMFASAYIQNKYEYRDLILNLGFRFEYFATKNKVFENPENPDENFDTALDVVDESKLKDQDPFSMVLPRISFSFPVSDRSVFFAMYGKYAQMPSLNQLFRGNVNLSRTISPITRGNAYLAPVGYFAKPERTTQYEVGFRQSMSDNFAFTISGYYKDLKDQLALRRFRNALGNPVFIAYLNEDFGTIKGLEMTLELRRTNRLAARVNYTLSDARGTGSTSNAAEGVVESPATGRFPNFINQLDYNQTHRGSLFLDYRFSKDDGGPILEGLGVNLLMTFNSGHAYTKIQQVTTLGQSNPWNVGVYPIDDPRFRVPVEPLNNSTTPWVFNVDLNLSKVFWIGTSTVEMYVNVLNLFNSKQIVNVHPATGTAQDDGWLNSTLAAPFASTPYYTDFYKAINIDNRWAYMGVAGDLYGSPRQVRVGMKLEL